MSRNTAILVLSALLACDRYETGIDRTVIQGNIELVPAETTEAETTQGSNESLELAEDLGFIGYRVARLHGTTLDYGADISTGKVNGDWDYYTFSPLLEGTLTLSFSYAGPGEVDTADLPKDDTVYAVQILDLDTLDESGEPTVIFEGDTAGYYGLFTADLTVAAKGHYAIGVGGSKNKSDDNTYEIRIDGFDPNGTQFLVGAYQEADFAEHGNPVGGTSVDSFEYDESTYTWSGAFEVLFIREVITCANADTDCLATQSDPPTTPDDTGITTDVNEDLPTVYLYAGTFSSLNAGILAGTHFSSEGVAVQLSTDDAETDLHTDVALRVDAIQPLLVGWQFTEEEPNDVTIDGATYNLTGDLTAANVLPLGTGLGYVDFLDGTLIYEVDDPAWSNDADVFAFEVGEQAGATISLGWANAADDLDLHFYDSAGTLLAAGWYIANSNPELFGTADFGLTLEPGQTYYLAVLGYGGAAGERDWSLSIEYTTP